MYGEIYVVTTFSQARWNVTVAQISASDGAPPTRTPPFASWGHPRAPYAPLSAAIAWVHDPQQATRGAVGAHIAGERAVAELLGFSASWSAEPPSTVRHAAEDLLPRQITRIWRGAVAEHAALHPFLPKELAQAAAAGGEWLRQVRGDPALAYSAALASALVDHNFLVVCGIGPTTILVVEDDERITEPLVGVLNTGLGGWQSLGYWDVRYRKIGDTPPPLLVLLACGQYRRLFPLAGSMRESALEALHLIRTRGGQQAARVFASRIESVAPQGHPGSTVVLVKRVEDLDVDDQLRRIEDMERSLAQSQHMVSREDVCTHK
jgi:hypothetical protein